jgi:2-polyprenyl-3-methyl-5-hydroxy-6-metoxy-1,4-benzoquinol methylase
VSCPNRAVKDLNPSYTTARPDLLSLVPDSASTILDVGCSVGALGGAIKGRRPGTFVAGIEYDPVAAEQARGVLDFVLNSDLNAGLDAAALPRQQFDCIICGDVLEHLVDPWTTLAQLGQLLTPDGAIIVSLPNVRHISTIYALVVGGEWPYRDRGIHDRTHLRFFTLKNLRALFNDSGLQILTLRRNHRLVEHPADVNRYAWLVAFWPLSDFFTFQFLILARRKPH